MDELSRALDDAISGRGRLVLLVGEPGIGKSRTAEEFAARADERGAEVLLGRCYEDEGAPALWPWTQIISAYGRVREDAELDAALGADATEIAQVVPELRARVSTDSATQSQDPQSARFRLFDGIATFLERAARTRPIVLVLDDLHGSDQPSLLLLRFIARRLREARLLIVGTFRDVALTRGDPLAETLAELLRESVTTRLSLRGFSEAEVGRFIETTAGMAAPAALVTRIHERTEGNPFFVGEIVRWLVESGELERPGRGIELAIPEGVRAAVARRLGRLPSECVEMLRLASGFGREFRADAVGLASGVEPVGMAEMLTDALGARLIVDVPDRPGRYRFAHALTRDALYEDVPAPHRAALHLRLAEALAEVTSKDADAPFAELGAQFLAASDRRGVDYTRRAGDRALEMLAYEEAVRQYGSALAALDRAAPADEVTRCDLMIALATAQNQAGETAAGKKSAFRAAESARRRGAREQLCRAALAYSPRLLWGDTSDTDPAEVALLEEALAGSCSEDSPLNVRLLARLGTALYYQGDAHARRAEASERAVEMARRLGDGSTLAYALYAQHLTMWVPGNAEERLAVATELVRLAETAGDTQMAFNGHFARFADHLELGNAAALGVELEAGQRLGEHRDPYQRLHVNAMRVTRALIEGRWDDATTLVGELQELYLLWPHNDVRSQIGLLVWRIASQRGSAVVFIPAFQQGAAAMPAAPAPRCILATLYAEAGRMDEARREYDAFVPDGLAQLRREPVGLALSWSQLAEACRELDDARGADALYAEMLPCADTCVAAGGLGFHGAVGLYLGMLATLRRRWTDAERHLAHALAMHERMNAAPWIARTRYEYAAMLLARSDTGDAERARTLLAEAREVATALYMNRLLSKVDDLSARTGEIAGVAHDGEGKTSASSLRERAGVAQSNRSPQARNGPGSAASLTGPDAVNVFRREGEYWTIRYAGAAVRLRDTKGLHYIAQLLAHPAREIHVADLATLGMGSGDDGARVERGMATEGDFGAIVDARAAAEYKERLADLHQELDDASAASDTGRAERARHEIELITRELSAAYGLGGRARRAGDPADRMRKAVTNQIRRVLERIDAVHPALGRHLRNALRTGFLCAYTPEHQVAWRL